MRYFYCIYYTLMLSCHFNFETPSLCVRFLFLMGCQHFVIIKCTSCAHWIYIAPIEYECICWIFRFLIYYTTKWNYNIFCCQLYMRLWRKWKKKQQQKQQENITRQILPAHILDSLSIMSLRMTTFVMCVSRQSPEDYRYKCV